MWSLLLSTAVAASSGEAAAAALAGAPTAEVAVACTPTGTLLAALGRIPLPPALLDEVPAAVRPGLTLLDPEVAASYGVDREGTLLLLGEGKENRDLQIPFRGTPEDATRLLDLLFDEVEASGEVWRITEDGKARLARIENGALRVQRIHTDDGTAAPLASMANLLAGLPGAPGCTVAVRKIDTEKADGAMALYVPLAGQAPLLLRMKIDQLVAPPELARGGPVGDTARSAEAPSAVLTIGVSIDALLDAASKDPSFPAADLQRLHGVVSFGPGASLALFGNPQERRFAAVVPLTAPDGSALPRGKVLRFLTRFSEGKVKRSGGGTFRGNLDDTTVFGAVDAGRIVIASDADLVQVVLADEGEAWLTPAMRAFTSDWPIAVQTRGEGGPMAVRAGVRALPEGTWELSVEVTGGSKEMNAMILGMASALAVPNFVEMSQKARAAAVARDVDAIRAAQLTWLTDHGTALAMPAHPRAVEALGKDGVAWTEQADWARLGWSPEGGEVRGTYWVEITPDGKGFTVWGAIDADGDGIPARWRATRDLPAERETGDNVY